MTTNMKPTGQSSHEKHFLTVHKLEQSMMSQVHWIKHSKKDDFPLFLKNMNPLYPRMCYVWLKFYLTPFLKGMTFHFNKIESPYLMMLWMIFTQWFLRSNFSKVVNVSNVLEQRQHQRRTRFNQKSSLRPSPQVSKNGWTKKVEFTKFLADINYA